MTEYKHHVPGRLRIRSPHLHCGQTAIQKVRCCIRSLHGVKDFYHNPKAASLTIIYDPDILSEEELMKALKSSGCISCEAAMAKNSVHNEPSKSEFKNVLVNMVVQTALQRSALKLVSAII